ncbi:MAG: sodium-dependent transporter [Desulfobacterales bacterium]|nr:sodium-dependent transporter [Desulfobacterales bacterium]
MQQSRESWASKIGVVLAVAGSAVGLGNFLVFPGRVAANGGGAFMIPYFIALILIGIPLAWMEWTMGRFGGMLGHGSAPGVLSAMVKRPYARYLGSIGVFGPLLILFFYVYIESWLLGFIWYALTGELAVASSSAETMGAFFRDYIGLKTTFSGIPAALFFFFIAFLLNFGIIYLGIRRGIETISKVLMPLLLVLGVIMLIRVLTLKGISSGLGFLWNPDFSRLLDINVWFAATSQVFFTLSIGIGTILTYASYVKKQQDIVLSSLTANAANEFFEVIIGGTIVIPTAVIFLGAAGAQDVARQGAMSLGFITMPMIFRQFTFMEANIGSIFQVLWFVLLFIAGLTSSISIIQPGISFLEDELELSKRKSVIVLAPVTLFYCLMVIFGMNAGAADEVDLWGFQFSLLFFGMIEALLFARIFGRDRGLAEMNRGADIRLPGFLTPVICYVTPAFLVVLLILWLTKGGGMDAILLNNLKEAQVSFIGLKMSNRTFIVLVRGCLLLFLAAINFAVYLAWKYKRSQDGVIQ